MFDVLKQNKIAALGIVVVLVAAAWYGISSSTNSTTALTSEVVDSKADKAVVDELLKLRAIRLEGAIFSDPAFVSLQDSGVDIVSEPIGRRNPFAPLDNGESDERAQIPARAATTTAERKIPSGGTTNGAQRPTIPRPGSEQ